MPNTNSYSIHNLIQLTGSGVSVADYAEIRDTLIAEFKKIYGTDIDISPASADGQYVNEIALIINNILQMTKHAYSQLNPNTATGPALDILCSYNNIKRRLQTRSVAKVWVKSLVESPDAREILFIDKNGYYWKWRNPVGLDGRPIYSWKLNEVKELTDVECEEFGPIMATGAGPLPSDPSEFSSGGTINKAVEFGKWIVYQEDDAEIGQSEENDSSLRSRRWQSLGSQSVSILSGVEGSLLELSGIEDVKAYSNSTADSETMSDGTELDPHSVYICAAYRKGSDPSAETIGGTIARKMTPGIGTNQPYPAVVDRLSEDTEFLRRYNEERKSYIVNVTSDLSYGIYWKKCRSVAPQVYCKFLCTENFQLPSDPLRPHSPETDVEKEMAAAMRSYLNKLAIDKPYTSAACNAAVQSVAGNPTKFYCIDGAVRLTELGSATQELRAYAPYNTKFGYEESSSYFAYKKEAASGNTYGYLFCGIGSLEESKIRGLGSSEVLACELSLLDADQTGAHFEVSARQLSDDDAENYINITNTGDRVSFATNETDCAVFVDLDESLIVDGETIATQTQTVLLMGVSE